ncbi:rhodanese-like domain-containing protein [Deinococcus radiopugnans]|uniref:Rhodanese-like domain-containing protein n=1 Tax=Deinococcus radiopugnans ATCC 19172 TaxID=585398 RepID=A0A5C4Y891_9DEIO|nr:rhodanese-like domain-containing protein [Deinococcus radiopugnans]MBB6017027.1 rhodanese-related sulfurtransferase [Deinococcus radiopugnans ATCC 19172]TNM71568.1 rhodanese-like domain-containing protein [Deinococcus radiopugnans ATCC 19172]
MPLPEGVTVIDLRPAELRFAQPLEPLLSGRPVLALSLDQIEDGAHGLTPASGPLLVICERGVRSGLAARYLRADGLEAEAYPGGVPALLRETR